MPLSGVWIRNAAIPYLENVDGSGDRLVPLKGGNRFSADTRDAAVSPDRKHVAYIDEYNDPIVKYQPIKRILRVINSAGQSLQMDYWKEDWQFIIGWTDNQHVMLSTASEGIVILNPFTGAWQKARTPDWLSAKLETNVAGYRTYAAPLYSPSLDQVIVDDADGFEIRETKSGKTIFHGQGHVHYRDAIDWSADSLKAAIITDGEVVILVENHHETMRFDVRTRMPDLEEPWNVRFSPDGHKLAMIARNSKTFDEQLLMLDLLQHTANVLCNDKLGLATSNIIWSPDNRFLIEESYDASDFTPSDILVDTQTMRAFKLVSGQMQHRILWLASP